MHISSIKDEASLAGSFDGGHQKVRKRTYYEFISI